jgi:outer membrane protein assembly factor BamB
MRRKYSLLVAGLFLAAAFFCHIPVLQAGDSPAWPQFLGPDRNGIVEGTKLLSAWPTNGPKQVWAIKCENGLSGPVIADGVLVLMERPNAKSRQDRVKMLNAEEAIRGIDIETGQELWRSTNACSFKGNGYCWGAASTPAIGKGKVVCLGIEGRLRCLELATGKLIWEKDLVTEYQSDQHKHWGVCTSPLIVENLVIVQICSASTNVGLVAWKLEDGTEAWKTHRFGMYGTESPTFMRVGDVPTIITAGSGIPGGNVFGVDARTGDIVWSVKSTASVALAAPTVGDGVVIFPSEQHDGTGMVALRPPANGQGTAEVIWDQADGHPIRFSVPLYYKGLVFGHGYPAHGGPHPFWCADAKDGALLWSRPADKEEHQCFIGSDGKVLQMHQSGELTLFDAAARQGYRELAQAKLKDGTWAFPALVNGRLYVRSHTQLVCLDLAAK